MAKIANLTQTVLLTLSHDGKGNFSERLISLLQNFKEGSSTLSRS